MRSTGLLGRLLRLYIGLVLYGGFAGLMVRARLGLDPWDVLQQGLAHHLHLEIGTVSIIVGAVVLVGWIPLRQRPGLGTVSNVFVVGLATNATLALLPISHGLAMRALELIGGVLLCAVATGLYIGANFGPGPRDGLMTGISSRSGRSIRLTRAGIELSVLISGWLLGGSVGAGTVLYAAAIGPLVQVSMRALALPAAGAEGGDDLRRRALASEAVALPGPEMQR